MNKLNIDWKRIMKKSELVKSLIDEKLPDHGKTLQILIWDDGDFKIEYRSGVNENLHLFTFHASVDKEVQYLCEEKFVEIILENGDRHWVDKDIIDEAFS